MLGRCWSVCSYLSNVGEGGEAEGGQVICQCSGAGRRDHYLRLPHLTRVWNATHTRPYHTYTPTSPHPHPHTHPYTPTTYEHTYAKYVHTLMWLVICYTTPYTTPPLLWTQCTCMDGTWLSLQSKPSNKTSNPSWWAVWLSFWNWETTGCNSKLSPPAARHTDIHWYPNTRPQWVLQGDQAIRIVHTVAVTMHKYVLQFQPYAITARWLGHQHIQTSVQLLSLTLWVAFVHPKHKHLALFLRAISELP